MMKYWSEAAKRCTPYVPGEQLNDPTIIKLNTNENPYPPSPNVQSAIKKEMEQALHLYPSPTVDSLREAIAKQEGTTKESVFVGNGSDEVLAFAFMGLFSPFRTIRFPTITYSFYPVYANLFQIPYEKVPLMNDFTLDETAFFHSEGGAILPNPNAPTSIFTSLDLMENIVKHNPDNVVIIDEAYVDFAPETAVALTHKYEQLLIVKTFSKSRSLAGLRVGYAIGHPHLIEALTRIKDSFNSYTIDRLAIVGAKAAIEDTAYFKQTTRHILQTREWTREQLEERGFSVLPSATNFLFVHHPVYEAEKLYQQLKEKKVLIRYFRNQGITDYMRITIGTDEMMRKFLLVLDQVMEGE
ncbi:histidinol-phosphate transaminase [Virgibacillus pantothenticus]|uniref:histidinol-phosphate transaminase n=1 Tax=Virgibacillus pantothenticus TaxID=1473 RepID=UPI000986CDD9|nr:histidinol-phosphate transaminase [Virgibacillus pantothenticus]